ncbi:hypothetical protein ACIA7S_41815 [Streptomyces sp. NPDC051643]|uniref:hypothetical protein n=1 Tax=Streptomyces sp. NPDC051643 TaxID=3365665 RepID=UPI003793B1C9
MSPATGEEYDGAGQRHRFVSLPHGGPLDLWAFQAYDRDARDWVSQYALVAYS